MAFTCADLFRSVFIVSPVQYPGEMKTYLVCKSSSIVSNVSKGSRA